MINDHEMRQPSDIPKLVIFDCDGVLVDSEPIFNRVLHEFLISCGAELSFLDCCVTFTGKSRHDVEAYMIANKLVIPDDWSSLFYAQALEALGRDVKPIEGVPSVLRKLKDFNVKFCVASNGIQEKMNVTLTRSQLLHYFEGNIFSAYDVGQSKPAPDVFLHAAKSNGVEPQDCVVVEDSASGFEAAFSAKMPCLAYLPEEDNADQNLFGARGFNDMRALPSLLGIV